MTAQTPAEIGRAKFGTMRDLMEKSKAQFARVLPSHMDADRLLRIALTQIRTNPRLLDCTPESMVGALMKAAQLGLEPDGVTGRAYLIPRRNARLGTVEVNFQRGYKGILELAYRSGQIASVRADVVREGDFLEYEKGLDEKLVHRPGSSFDAPVTHVYAIISLKQGGNLWDIWPSAKVEAHRRRFSKDSRDDSVWSTDWEAMAKKTLLIAVGNLAPQSIEWAHAADEERTGGEGVSADIDIVDGFVTEPAPVVEAPKSNAEKLKAAARKNKGAAAGSEPTEVYANAPVATESAAPSAPAAAPVSTPEPAWRTSTNLVEVFSDIVRRELLTAEALRNILAGFGASRGHADGLLGLSKKPEAQEALIAALRDTCQGDRV
jgi:recombination protein RecT